MIYIGFIFYIGRWNIRLRIYLCRFTAESVLNNNCYIKNIVVCLYKKFNRKSRKNRMNNQQKICDFFDKKSGSFAEPPFNLQKIEFETGKQH